MPDYYDGYDDGSYGYCRRDSDPRSSYSEGYREAERDMEEAHYRRIAEQRRQEEDEYYDRQYESYPEPPYQEPTLDDICEGYGHPFQYWHSRFCGCGQVKRSRFACYKDWLYRHRQAKKKEHA